MNRYRIADPWDGVEEEKRLRKSLQKAKLNHAEQADERLKISLRCYLVHLADMDLVSHLVQSECFSTRETFLGELRRLMVEPTAPSIMVPSLEEYREAQRWWLERMLELFEARA